MDSSFETPIKNFRRLIDEDFNSNKFKIIYQSSDLETAYFELSRNEARILSKQINNFYIIDPTIDQYILSLSSTENSEIKEVLNLLIKSLHEKVTIPKEQEKLFQTIQFILGEEETNENSNIYNIKEAISLLSTENENKAVNFLSENLLKLIESGEMNHINKELIFAIIDSYLEKENKDEKEIEKIFSTMKNQQEEASIVFYFILSLKNEYKSEFINEILEYIIENLDDDILQNELHRITIFIRNYLIEKVEFLSVKNKVINAKFEGNELSGIISYLKRKFGNELVKNGELKLSCGGQTSSIIPLTNIIKYDEENINKYCCNDNGMTPSSENDSWIEFDFIKRKIKLTSYTLRTGNNVSNSYYKPKSWRIIGSNDKINWCVLDHQVNNQLLNGIHKMHRFECEKSENYYRYIRYVQEDSCNSTFRKFAFLFTCIEMFGSILEP